MELCHLLKVILDREIEDKFTSCVYEIGVKSMVVVNIKMI